MKSRDLFWNKLLDFHRIEIRHNYISSWVLQFHVWCRFQKTAHMLTQLCLFFSSTNRHTMGKVPVHETEAWSTNPDMTITLCKMLLDFSRQIDPWSHIIDDLKESTPETVWPKEGMAFSGYAENVLLLILILKIWWKRERKAEVEVVTQCCQNDNTMDNKKIEGTLFQLSFSHLKWATGISVVSKNSGGRCHIKD